MERLVSIIVPVYNVESYVKECLDSLINQTYQNLDIIIIDNDSHDLSGTICREYAEIDKRIHYTVQQNKGVSLARNTGLKLAKGDYVCFCDADDTYELNYVENMVQIKEKTKADLVICGYSKAIGDLKKVESKIKVSQFVNQEFLVEHIFLNNNIGGYVWNKIFDTKLLDGVYFDESYQICEDMDFVFHYLCNCKKIYVTTQSLYNYRMRNGSAVNDIDNLFDEDNQLKYAIVPENILKLNILTEQSKECVKCGIYMSCVSALCDYKIQNGRNSDIIVKLKFKIRQYQKIFLRSKKVGIKKKLIVTLNQYCNVRRLKKLFCYCNR